MKSKSFVLMIVSLGFGLVAAIGISQVMGRNNGGQNFEIPKRTVVVAAVDLEHNSYLTEENVKVEEWPLEIIPENTAASLEQIADMATRQSLAKGMPINLGTLVHKKQMADINIPRGYTVYSVKASAEDTSHGLLRPGDKVNVIGHIRGKPAKTFLRGLRVWTVNAQMTAKLGSREEGGASGDAIVGILTNERQTELIMQVQQEGSIKLVLRGDHFEADTEESLDEEGMIGLGLILNESSASAEINKPSSPAPQFQPFMTPAKQQHSKSIRIWTKEGVETVTFKEGVAVSAPAPLSPVAPNVPVFPGATPENSSPAPQNPVLPRGGEEFSGSVESIDYSDRERGLEEDQH